MEVLLQQIANSFVLGGVYVMVTLGLFLIFTALDIPNFAHGAMLTIGAYLQYTLVVRVGLSFWIALVLVTLVVAALGVLMEMAVFRPLQKAETAHGLAMLVGALALFIALQAAVQLIWGVDPLSVAPPISGVLRLGPIVIGWYEVLIAVIALVAAGMLGVLVYASAFGRQLRAVTQNRQIATLAGVNGRRVGVVTFAIGTGLAGLAGALLAPALNLDSHMGFHPLLVAFVILVAIGGGGRILAVVACGFVIAILETLTAGYIANDLREVVVFVALVLFLMVRPEGAFREGATQKVRL